ncbi:MAG TPA: hypothetical protein VN258_14805 [Mobilitalea sp.]|nr:hypothetical protein [Mobilitalea sp.]
MKNDYLQMYFGVQLCHKMTNRARYIVFWEKLYIINFDQRYLRSFDVRNAGPADTVTLVLIQELSRRPDYVSITK